MAGNKPLPGPCALAFGGGACKLVGGFPGEEFGFGRSPRDITRGTSSTLSGELSRSATTAARGRAVFSWRNPGTLQAAFANRRRRNGQCLASGASRWPIRTPGGDQVLAFRSRLPGIG